MFKIVVFDAEFQRWLLISVHRKQHEALFAGRTLRGEHRFQMVATILVKGDPRSAEVEIEMLEADFSRADQLLRLAEFRAAALRLQPDLEVAS